MSRYWCLRYGVLDTYSNLPTYINNIYNLSNYIYYYISVYFKFLLCNTDGGFNNINKKIEKVNFIRKKRNYIVYNVLLYYKMLNPENVKKYCEKI